MRHEGLNFLSEIVESIRVVDDTSSKGDAIRHIVGRVSSTHGRSEKLDQKLELKMSTKRTAAPIAYTVHTQSGKKKTRAGQHGLGQKKQYRAW